MGNLPNERVVAPEIQTIVDGVKDLPPLPLVVSRLLMIVSNPDHALVDLEEVIKLDAALSAAAMKLANSARFRPRSGEVTTLRKAVWVLGETQLVQLVLMRSSDALRPKELKGYGLGAAGYWRRSLRTAIAAERLSRKVPSVWSGLAYIAGLMADIGKMALGPHLEGLLSRVLQTSDYNKKMGFDQVERTVIGIDHAELGWHLARSWQIPDAIATAVEFHHRPNAAPEFSDLCYVVHVADALASMAARERGVDSMRYPLDEFWLDRVPVEEDELHDLIGEIDEAVKDAERLMSL